MNNYLLLNSSNIFLKKCIAFKANLDKKFLSSLNNPNHAFTYLRSTGAVLIGGGINSEGFTSSSRFAFAINSKKAIKLSKSFAYAAQNKNEFKILTNYKSPLLPKIYDADPYFKWIEVELVRPLKSRAEFLQRVGFSMKSLMMFICKCMNRSPNYYLNYYEDNDPEKYEQHEDISETEFAKNLFDLYKQTNLNLVEFTDHENLGINSEGNIVLLDLGVINK